MAEFGEEIMVLEGLENGTQEVTSSDVLSALFDFPKQENESLLSGALSAEDELGIPFPHPRPHHRPHGRPYPVPYPAYSPVYTNVLPVTAVATVKNKPEMIKRIRALEAKLAKLFPDKVKLLNSGIEGLDIIDLSKVAATMKAAANPNAPVSKAIVQSLSGRAKDLDKLVAARKLLAQKSLQNLKKSKSTVERLERVARAKVLQVLNAASAGKTSPEIAAKMNSILLESRRLQERAVETGKNAVQDAKVYGSSALLSKNAQKQAALTKAVKDAIQRGRPEEAKALTAGLVKSANIAKGIKNIRAAQVRMWSSQNREQVLNRLADRGVKFSKAAALLGKKAGEVGLTKEDQRNLKDAHVQLYKTKIAMGALKPGAIFPEELMKSSRESAFSAPVFSEKPKPNDRSGTFLEAIRESEFSINYVDKKNPSHLFGLGAIRESEFSVRSTDKKNPSHLFGFEGSGNLLNDVADLSQLPAAKAIEVADKFMRFGRQANATKLVSAMNWDAILRMSPIARQNAIQQIQSGSKGIANEMKRKASGIIRYVSNLGQFPVIPKTIYVRNVPAVTPDFPVVPEVVRIKKSLENFPGFPEIYNPVWERKALSEYGSFPGFPEIPESIRIKKSMEGVDPSIVAPVLLA